MSTGDQLTQGTDANTVALVGAPLGGGTSQSFSAYQVLTAGILAGGGKLPANPTSGAAGYDFWFGAGDASGGNANGGSIYAQLGLNQGSGTAGSFCVVSNAGATVATVDNAGNITATAFYVAQYTAVKNYSGAMLLGSSSSANHMLLGSGGSATIGSTGSFGWTSGDAISTLDTTFFRDGAADTIAQRRGTNAQTFRVYATYTDGSNYERFAIRSASNVFYCGPQTAGTGAADRATQYDMHPTQGRAFLSSSADGNTVYLGCQSQTALTISQAGTGSATLGLFNTYWLNASTIPLIFGLSNSGVTNRQGDSFVIRVRGGSGNATQSFFGIGVAYPQASGTTAHGQEDALLVRLNATATTVLAFGSSFANTVPALIRSGTILKARLADDSGDATLQGKLIVPSQTAPANASDTGTAGEIRWDSNYIYVCTATNTWKRVAIATW